jgi:aryl-alcohol dehydrogenase-like predicted oxidoreductase
MYSKIILGTAQFGMKYGIANNSGKIKYPEINRILNFLCKKKIKLLDTAFAYGVSEREIGKFYKKKKKKFKIITKLSFKNDIHIIDQYKASLNSLGYIPSIILAHSSKDYLNRNFHKHIKVLKKKYYITKIGVSLYNISELQKVLAYKRPDFVQVPINIFDQRFLNEKVLKILEHKSIKIIARSIFLQGLLFKNKNFIFKNFKNVQNNYLKLLEIAKKEKMNLGQLSLNWVYHLKKINNIVIGIDNLKHLKENLNIINKRIAKKNFEEIKKINLNNNQIIRPYLWKIK